MNLLGIVIVVISCSYAQRLKSDKMILNRCMDGKHHETKPSKTELFGVCKPWGSNSCCTNQTAYHIQKPFSELYNLNMSHCGPMSDKCLRRFYLASCFYECSPNVGPWLKKVKSSIRNERFVHIPLCVNDCEGWWNDCKDDMTCVDNFNKGFDWINGTNHCPADRKCEPVKIIFKNSTNFCESVYLDDFKVEKDSSKCMAFDFSGPENPNAKVARAYAVKKKMYVPKSTTAQPTEISTDVPGTTVATTIPGNALVTKIVLPIVLLILVAVLGFCVYKGRDYFTTSKRAGTKFCPCFKRGTAARHSVLRHQSPQEDQQFLNEEREDSEDTPHGALEIDL